MDGLITIQWISNIGGYNVAAMVSVNGKWCTWTLTEYYMGISEPHYPLPTIWGEYNVQD